MLYNFYLTQFSISAIIKKKIGRRPYTLNHDILMRLVSSYIISAEMPCSTGLSFIWEMGNNMSQSKTAVPLSQALPWVFHKDPCWAQYILYINDMYRSSNKMRFGHFTDDATVFASDSDINNVDVTVNRERVGVENWLKANRLSLNVSKTSYMMTSNQKKSYF